MPASDRLPLAGKCLIADALSVIFIPNLMPPAVYNAPPRTRLTINLNTLSKSFSNRLIHKVSKNRDLDIINKRITLD